MISQKFLLVLIVPFISLPTTMAVKAPFSYPTLTYKRFRSSKQIPAPTPAPALRQLVQRDERTCGVLEGYYTDAQPVCSGSASFCTFTGATGYQGCCQDGSLDHCTFYTTCYAYSDRASCTGSCMSSALFCPSSAPECTQYAYQWEPNPPESHWTGFGCGSQHATIYAFAVNGIEQSQSATTTTSSPDPSSSTPSTSTSSDSSPRSSTSAPRSHAATSTSQSPSISQTIFPPPTGPSSTIVSTAVPAATSSSSAGALSVLQSHKHIGAIVGGAIGGAVALALLLGFLIRWRIHRKKKERSNMAPMTQRELGRPWNT